MFEFKKVTKSFLAETIEVIATENDLNVENLEKDYWVSFVLNFILTKSKWKDSFIFKGGTSLSKCFNIIERFSEDIDLILDWRALGYQTNEPWEERSNTKQKKLALDANQKTSYFLKNEIVPEMIAYFNDFIDEDVNVYVHDEEINSIIIDYPRSFDSVYLTQAIKLEVGALAAWTPSQIVSIKPDIQPFAPGLFDGTEMKIRTATPERTFWEKLSILHHEANRPKDSIMPKRYARHYYDVYKISNSKYKSSALAQPEILDEVIRFKMKFYARGWADFENATTKTIKLVPEDYRLKIIELDYEAMTKMFYEIDKPAFEEIITTLRELEEEIHNL